MKHILLSAFVALIVCTRATAAQFTFERTAASPELHRLTLQNDDAMEIVGFTLSIGDDTRNFDSFTLVSASTGVVPVLHSPDGINAGLRSDLLSVTFTGLLSGMNAVMKADLDGDTGSQTVDWQTTLFNNGGLPNAMLTVRWTSGLSRSVMLHDVPDRDPLEPYRIAVSPLAVPEPGSIAMMVMGFVCLMVTRVLRA